MMARSNRSRMILGAGLALVMCLGFVHGCAAGGIPSGTDATTPRSTPSAPPVEEAAKVLASPERISLRTPDGVQIVGTFYGSEVEHGPAVLMLHQWGGNRRAYDALARQLQAQGISSLAIDGRGWGESTRRGDQTIKAARTDEAVAGMKLDVQAAVNFLARQPSVDSQRIGVVGASYGSSLAIIHAAQDSTIKAVALLSPGLNYFGNLPTEPAVRSFGARALLSVAAEDDPESATAVRKLDGLAQGDKHRLKIYRSGGHGTGLFAARVGVEQLLQEFFKQNL